MKLFDNKRIRLIFISAFFGMCFSTYLLYEQRQRLGLMELVALGLTLLTVIAIVLVLNKKANKE